MDMCINGKRKIRVNILPVNSELFHSENAYKKVMFTFLRTFSVLHQKWTSQMAGAQGLEPWAYGFGDDADKSASGELPFEVNISTIQKEIAATSATSYQKTKQIGNFRNKPTVFWVYGLLSWNRRLKNYTTKHQLYQLSTKKEMTFLLVWNKIFSFLLRESYIFLTTAEVPFCGTQGRRHPALFYEAFASFFFALSP